MKKLVITFCLLLLAMPAFAKQDNANILDLPRELPANEITSPPSGKKYKLQDFKNTFTIVVFWSRYCAPCIKEMKILNEFALKTKNDGFKVILVSPSKEWNSPEEEKRILENYGVYNIDYFNDHKGQLASDLGLFTTPYTIIMNKSAMEVGRIKGSIDWDKKEVIDYMYDLKAQSNRKPEIMPVKKIKVEELK